MNMPITPNPMITIPSSPAVNSAKGPKALPQFGGKEADQKKAFRKKDKDNVIVLDQLDLGKGKKSLYLNTAKLALKVGLDKKALFRDTLWLGAYAVAVALTPLVFTLPFVPFYYIFSISARSLLSAPEIYKHLKQMQGVD